ncbi:MAG: M28 family peptidase [Pyrodictiaceae archaeon]
MRGLIVEVARRLVKELAPIGEVRAGGREERIVLDVLRARLEDLLGVRARLDPVPVLYWAEKEPPLLEACGYRIRGAAWPGSPRADLEARLVAAEPRIEPGYWARLGVEDSIVLVELPEELDDADTIYLYVVENGGLGVVFYDRWPGRLRRIVVTGSWGYSFEAGQPPPIPVAHMRREDALKLLSLCREGARARLWLNISYREDVGYNLLATIAEGEEGYVLVTCHHDHWFTGANDNLAGIAAAIATLLDVEELLKGSKLGVRLASFTAEEYGSPLQPGWYWSWGSRYYAENLERMGLLEEIVAVLNYDMPSGRLKIHATGVEMQRLLERAAQAVGVKSVHVGLDSCYTDSFSFSRLGVPSASIIDLEGYLEYYHTDLDEPSRLDYDAIAAAVAVYREAIRILAREGLEALDYRGYAERIYEEAQHYPPPLRASAYKLLRETEKSLEEGRLKTVARAYRRLNRLAVRPVFRGDYRLSSGGFTNTLLPQLDAARAYQSLLEAIEEGDWGRVEKVPYKIIVPGDERVLAELRPLGRVEPAWLEALRVAAKAQYDRLLEEARLVLEEAYQIMLRDRLRESMEKLSRDPRRGGP